MNVSEDILFYAFRYALGRMTYAVNDGNKNPVMIYLALHNVDGSRYEAAAHQKLVGPFPDRETAMKYSEEHENDGDGEDYFDLIDTSEAKKP